MDRRMDGWMDKREYWLLKWPDLNFQCKGSTSWLWTFDVRMPGLNWVQIVWKGYQQTKISFKGLLQSQNISVQLHFVITFKVLNSLDPDMSGLIWVQIFLKGLSADDNVM